MSLTENSNQLFLPGGATNSQNSLAPTLTYHLKTLCIGLMSWDSHDRLSLKPSWLSVRISCLSKWSITELWTMYSSTSGIRERVDVSLLSWRLGLCGHSSSWLGSSLAADFKMKAGNSPGPVAWCIFRYRRRLRMPLISQELEVRSLNHPYSLKTKSSQCHYVITLWAFGFEAIGVI